MTLSFELMAPLMFAGLIVVLLIGYPVAFSLSAVGLGFGFLAIQLGYFDFVLLQALPERIFGIASNQLLLSIPMVVNSYKIHEYSSDAGGLLRWPIKIMIPLGFALLALQGLAEIIKKTAIARGIREPGKAYERPVQ